MKNRRINYSLEEWELIFYKFRVIEKLSIGVSYKALAVDLKENGYPCTGEAVRKAVARLGFKKDPIQKVYYRGAQEEAVKLMNSIDVESVIENISAKRYYDCAFGSDGYFYRENIETEGIYIDKQILKELEKISEKLGVEYVQEYITYILLKHLDEVEPANRLREFSYKYLNESNRYSDEEKEIIIKKEREGFNLYHMVIHGLDNYITEMTDEDFIENITKKRDIEPF
ncbi:hypothetical protein [Clostridium celatum]|uniref:Uncharacterized protein n=1 Tax=Clostridium celatum DSM 1785 TaxID=545697 RepID=L1Q487_9CLOT|nr:hypothetical protein [Clostridium celatum]EKY22794.1 hypothetical protein HMPREF0216_03159 [Clostridium celatum DSM 1785]MCE9653890.1 hypothetical protein [Clostridium celatum]